MFFELRSTPMFFALAPSASFEDGAIKTGLPFLICAFAAIVTDVSVIPEASFESVFPVHGAIITIS